MNLEDMRALPPRDKRWIYRLVMFCVGAGAMLAVLSFFH